MPPIRTHAEVLAAYVGFANWNEVLDFARADTTYLYYRAPLSYYPCSVRVVKVYKNGKVRLDPGHSAGDPFTADCGHLDRFLRRKPVQS